MMERADPSGLPGTRASSVSRSDGGMGRKTQRAADLESCGRALGAAAAACRHSTTELHSLLLLPRISKMSYTLPCATARKDGHWDA